jgi:type VI secretion system protein VasD
MQMHHGRKMIRLFPACVTCLVALLCSCASAPDRPVPLRLNIAVAANANPDDSGRPSPVVISIFDLARQNRFRNADYLALLTTPQHALQGDMLASHRVTAIVPGVHRSIELMLDAKTRHIGIVAEVVSFSGTSARATVELKPGQAQELNLEIAASGITVVADKLHEPGTFSRFNDD